MPDLDERVTRLREWANRRIQECRRQESTPDLPARDRNEAAVERVTLMFVLTELGFPVPPRERRA